MNQKLSHRKATTDDLQKIVELLLDDELGRASEIASIELDARYMSAFSKINADPDQYLMVAVLGPEIVGTCHLKIMPSLTFTGQSRLQIEAVRVDKKHRGQGIGEWMINAAIDYGRAQGATIIQLMTNKKRIRAIKFYEKLGFEATHEGMKLLV